MEATDHHDLTRNQEALAGFPVHHLQHTPRAVKASPPGGLRPALTALPPGHHAGLSPRPDNPTEHAPPAAETELLYEEHC
jgi:hypothetical protein